MSLGGRLGFKERGKDCGNLLRKDQRLKYRCESVKSEEELRGGGHNQVKELGMKVTFFIWGRTHDGNSQIYVHSGENTRKLKQEPKKPGQRCTIEGKTIEVDPGNV